ncbi:MAG: DNA-processing protein DprA [Lachnospiraceae bacterium]|nr:DNA-processing protein DprA [Lachnospiraceae bacterium]
MEYDGSLVYYLWLTKINGIGPVTQHALLEELNTPEAVYYASEEKLLRTGMTENRIRLILEARDLDDARQELEQCREQGIFLMTYRDEIYPKELRSVPDLPVLLYGKGKPELFSPKADLKIDLGQKWQPFGPDYVPTELDWWWKDEPLINCPNRRVAVIGARRCTREDKEKCINRVKRIGEDNPGAIIISGGAKGIDGYAHTAAIKNGLRTIAFIGTGPDLCYPKEHSELFRQIGEHGMILSEYPPGTAAYPSHFPRRNRLIAAWSDEMYVIGAGRNSGTRSTVQYFHKYHKEQGC